MPIGILGGTFDPPHKAHVGAIQYVLGHGLVEQVFVIPVFSHAFAKRPRQTFVERLHLCELAFSALPGVRVLDIEGSLPEPNYTVETVRALIRAYPKETFRLMMGTDVGGELSRWHEADDLVRLAPPLLLERQGYPDPDALPADLPDVSSSILRGFLRQFQQNPGDLALRTELERLLPLPVLTEILDRGFYRE
jgi:nicotinate-nucleotide adenylyltransferase